jgi:hypothetical protein
MKPLFQVVYTDGTTFNGGDFENTKWLEIPTDKKIRSLFYLLPTGDYLCLGGYERFFHIIECTTDLNGENSGVKNFEFACIIGQKKDYTSIYQIDLRDGCINLKNIKNDDKFLEKLNKNNWR